MVTFSFINPLDQPTGRRRLLTELKDGVQDDKFSSLKMIVAFAKAGPLLRLKPFIDARRAKGLSVEAIFGVDQQGTSAQALAFALEHFDKVYVTREPNFTFHPKMYCFQGGKLARLFVGSNNLTVGGTETNFEAAVQLDIELPSDADALRPFTECWTEMLPGKCPATKLLGKTLLAELIRDGVVPDETTMRKARATGTRGVSIPKAPRSGLVTKPPSALPARKPIKSTSAAAAPSPDSGATARTATKPEPYGAQGLAIQIKPHHNGEIFLSVTAALQNPPFFKWPFKGATVPKKGSNTAYPQLSPDPLVNITVYGAKASPLLTLNAYALNTVYYEKKSEIRVTASPLVGVVPDYSVMVMQQSELDGVDYDITIHTPDSPDYAAWVTACNQQMPSGGQKPRKFGWF